MNDLSNISHIIKDIIQGDVSLLNRNEISKKSFNDVKKGLQLIINDPNLSDLDKKKLILNSWRLLYKVKPPTIEQFLSYEWIGGVVEDLYPWVRQTLIEFFNPNKKYRNLLLAPHIGWGKTTLSVLANLFITVNLWCMHNPKKVLGLAHTTSLVQVLISFTKDKSKELMLDPFKRILETSDRFKKCMTEDQFIKRTKEDRNDIIYYTTAGTHALQFSNNLNYKIASTPGDIIGLTMVSSTMSELSFFVEQRGFSPDLIWQIYQDSMKRINSRLKGHYWGRIIMDSSPNDIRLPIDKYIFSGEAEKDENNYVVTGPEWESKKEDFDFNKMFPVFKGSSTQVANILEKENIKQYNDNDIIWIPEYYKSGISYKKNFENDLIKSLKDLAGVPAGGDNYLIINPQIIEDIFYDTLNNIYTYIIAPANKKPERLIWDQVEKDLFIHLEGKKYEFYRAAKELRYIHVDQSETADMTSICMVHPERSLDETVIVVDFTINIRPDKDKVNLDAIIEFILDLIRLGRISIGKVTFDQYQSSVAKQRLKRYDINVENLSVDRNPEIYETIVSWIKNRRVKSGKNIFLKNNLKSVKESRTDKGIKKIDHSKGKLVYEDHSKWESSNMGINAKDTSDALVGACHNLLQEYKEVPMYQWEEHFMQSNLSKEETLQLLKDKAMERVYTQYGFKIKTE